MIINIGDEARIQIFLYFNIINRHTFLFIYFKDNYIIFINTYN